MNNKKHKLINLFYPKSRKEKKKHSSKKNIKKQKTNHCSILWRNIKKNCQGGKCEQHCNLHNVQTVLHHLYCVFRVTIYTSKAAAEGLSFVSVSTSNGNTPHIPHLNRPVFACSSFPPGEFELSKGYERLGYSLLLRRILQIRAPRLQNIIVFWTYFDFFFHSSSCKGDSESIHRWSLDWLLPQSDFVVLVVETVTHSCCFYWGEPATHVVEDRRTTWNERWESVFTLSTPHAGGQDCVCQHLMYRQTPLKPSGVTVECFHVMRIPLLSVHCCQGRLEMKNHMLYVALFPQNVLISQQYSWHVFLPSLKGIRIRNYWPFTCNCPFFWGVEFLVFTNTEIPPKHRRINHLRWQMTVLRSAPQYRREISTFFSFATGSWMYFQSQGWPFVFKNDWWLT